MGWAYSGKYKNLLDWTSCWYYFSRWFFQNSQTYYEVFLSEISLSNKGWLLFAYYNEKPIAAGIFVYYEDQAIYYYGASVSDRDLRKHMAPYLIQWEALLEGKRRGCCSYDFLGIAHLMIQRVIFDESVNSRRNSVARVRKLPEKKLLLFPGSIGYFSP